MSHPPPPPPPPAKPSKPSKPTASQAAKPAASATKPAAPQPPPPKPMQASSPSNPIQVAASKPVQQSQPAAKALLAMKLELETEGPSVTLIHSDSFLVVRQGEKLQLINIQTQQIESASASLPVYNKFPCAIYQDKYVEITADKVFVVQVPAMTVSELPALKFLQALETPSFTQIGQFLVVFNVANLYLYDIELNTLKYSSQFEGMPFVPKFGCLTVNDADNLWLFGFDDQQQSNTLIKLSLIKHEIEIIELPMALQNCYGIFVKGKFFIFGPVNVDAPEYGSSIIKFDHVSHELQLIYSHSSDFSGSIPAVAGGLFLIADNFTRFCVFESEIADFYLENAPVAVIRAGDEPLTKKQKKAPAPAPTKPAAPKPKVDMPIPEVSVEADLVMQLDLATEGPSVTLIHDNDHVVVRQGDQLQLIDIKQQTLEEVKAVLPVSYNKMPCGLFESRFVEIQPDKTIFVTVPAMEVSEGPALEFVHPLETPAFTQIDRFVVIFNVTHLYVYDIEKKCLKFSSFIENMPFVPRYGSLIPNSAESLWFLGFEEDSQSKKLLNINLWRHEVSVTEVALKVPHCQGFFANGKFYLVGAVNADYPEYASSLIRIDPESSLIELIYSHSSDLCDAKFAVADNLIVMADQMTRAIVIDSPLAVYYAEYGAVPVIRVGAEPLRSPALLEKELNAKIADAQDEEARKKLLEEQEAAKKGSQMEELKRREAEARAKKEAEAKALEDELKLKAAKDAERKLQEELADKERKEREAAAKAAAEEKARLDKIQKEKDDLEKKIRDEQDEESRAKLEAELRANAARNAAAREEADRLKAEAFEKARLERERITAEIARKRRENAHFELAKKEKVQDRADSEKFADVMKFWAQKNQKK